MQMAVLECSPLNGYTSTALSVMKYFIVRYCCDRDLPTLTKYNILEFHVSGFETLFGSF